MNGKLWGAALGAGLLLTGGLSAGEKNKIPYFANETFESNFQKGIQASVTLEDGRVVDLHDDFTWDWAPHPAAAGNGPLAMPETAQEAVDVWDSSLDQVEADGSNEVRLFLNYRNHTSKRVVGVSISVKIANSFGKTLFQFSKDDEVVVDPMEQMKNDAYFVWKDNPYIDGEPYDALWESAKNGTAKISVTVRKVLFEDGTQLTNAKARPQ